MLEKELNRNILQLFFLSIVWILLITILLIGWVADLRENKRALLVVQRGYRLIQKSFSLYLCFHVKHQKNRWLEKRFIECYWNTQVVAFLIA